MEGPIVIPAREKIKPLEEIKADCEKLKQQRKTIVFTNGCFDILHPGHTRYLEQARSLGDYLIVAVNSDGSIRKIKGPGRPIMPESARAEVLAALQFVDAVVIFEEPDPYCIIKELVPHVLVKGGDWAEDEIIGSDIVKTGGGRVVRIPYIEGLSTTAIIERIAKSFRN